MSRESIHIKLPAELVARLRAAADKTKDHYAPQQTAIVEAGLQRELDRLDRISKGNVWASDLLPDSIPASSLPSSLPHPSNRRTRKHTREKRKK